MLGGRRGVVDVEHRRGLERVVGRDLVGRRGPVDDLSVGVGLGRRQQQVAGVGHRSEHGREDLELVLTDADPGSACHTILSAASEMVLPSTSTGAGSAPFSTVAVQPGTGSTSTALSGVSVGRATSTLTVDAVSDSVGTRKFTVA